MKHIRIRPTDFVLGAVLSVATVVAMAGCGARTPSAATSSAVTTSPTSIATVSPSPDIPSARAAALTIFYGLPNQKSEVWGPCSQRASNFADCPFTASVVTRLNHLSSVGFESDGPGGCGEDYITGTQNGMRTAPQVLSAVSGADGNVTVVIQRGPATPNLTVTMTLQNSKWLASDLASGTGPSASIFSAKPNC